jgi:DNA-binding LytR/AlgR family response regulator
MKVVIVEDEVPAASRLVKLINNIDSDITVLTKIDSIEASVKYFGSNTTADLIFMDNQLADGISFDIFTQVNISTPVIFTTAFDQFTLRAFKVNSIDYLLKPIDEKELQQAINKYKLLYKEKNKADDNSDKILKALLEINGTKYKERLLIKKGQQLSYLKTEMLSHCYADGKLCYAIDNDGNKFMLENNLLQLETQLSPDKFFRINRHLLVNIESVKKIHTWLGGRLKLELQPASSADTVVSRERVNSFKEWLGGR